MTLGGWQHVDPEGLHGLNVCVACEEAFSCLSAIDAHVRGDDECRPPDEVGLVRHDTGEEIVWAWPVAKNKRNDDKFRRDIAEVRS